MQLTERQLRIIVRRSLNEKVSWDAPFGETVKDGLENIDVAGVDIDDIQLGLDVIGIGADAVSGIAAAASPGPQAVGTLPVAGVAGVVSIIADSTNALLYAARGEYFDMTLSLIAIVPIAGSVVKVGGKGGKVAVKYILNPLLSRVSKGGGISMGTIQKIVDTIDPSVASQIPAGTLVSIQKQINAHTKNIQSFLGALEAGDVAALNKVLPKKLPEGGMAERGFNWMWGKAKAANPDIMTGFTAAKAAVGFFSDAKLMKYTDDLLAAKNGGPEAMKAFKKQYAGVTDETMFVAGQAKKGQKLRFQSAVEVAQFFMKGGTKKKRAIAGILDKIDEGSPEYEQVVKIAELMEEHGEDSPEVRDAMMQLAKSRPELQKIAAFKEVVPLQWESRIRKTNTMKITRNQIGRIIREVIDFSDREANPHDGSMHGEPEGGYDASLAEEAYDILYDYLDSRPGSNVTFEELKEIVNDTRYLPGEDPIPDDQINHAITELEGDGVMTALLMPIDYNDRSKGWTVGNIGY